MFPVSDSVPVRSKVYITWVLMILNLITFAAVITLPPLERGSVYATFGFTPTKVFSSLLAPLTMISASFFHTGFLHFAFNILFLWIFGNNIEGLMGAWRFLAFYLLSGVVAALLHTLTHLNRTVPAVGASGAIAAVMGAYFIYFPHSKINLQLLFWRKKIPATTFLGLWFFFQLNQGLKEIANAFSNTDTVLVSKTAWWAHIGGFLFGILTVRYFANGKEPPDLNKHLDSNSFIGSILRKR